MCTKGLRVEGANNIKGLILSGYYLSSSSHTPVICVKLCIEDISRVETIGMNILKTLQELVENT